MKDVVNNAIRGLLEFCKSKIGEALWPNGPTGAAYLDGLVRVDANGVNRGSYVKGLDTLDKTLDFLRGLSWQPVVPAPGTSRKGCQYYMASIPEEYLAYQGVVSLAQARKLGLVVKAVAGAHGDELVARCNFGGGEHLPFASHITLIVEGGMMSTWYPGVLTAAMPKEIPLDQGKWSRHWAVKLVPFK